MGEANEVIMNDSKLDAIINAIVAMNLECSNKLKNWIQDYLA